VAIVVLGLAYSHESSDTVQIASNRVVNITSMEDFRPLNADYLHADIFETDELSVNISDFVTTENERWAVAHTYGERCFHFL
jgi:hypothetical protein